MVEAIKIGNKTLVMDGKILSLFRRGSLLRQMYYGGYEDFDGANGGVWKKYINIPIKTVPLEYAQYLIEIDDTNVSVYNVEGTLKAQASIASEFWSLVRSDGFDIRVFDHLFNQLWFWVEEFDYTNKKAKIWVKLPENSEELNIAFGNEKASESSYNNGDETFEFFDDFLGTSLDTNKWTKFGAGSVTVSDSAVHITVPAQANVRAGIKTLTSYGSGYVYVAKILECPLVTYQEGEIGWFSKDDQDAPSPYATGMYVHTNDAYYFSSVENAGRQEYTIDYSAGDIHAYVLSENYAKFLRNWSLVVTDTTPQKTPTPIGARGWSYSTNTPPTSRTISIDWIFMLKLADPATFDTPRIVEF